MSSGAAAERDLDCPDLNKIVTLIAQLQYEESKLVNTMAEENEKARFNADELKETREKIKEIGVKTRELDEQCVQLEHKLERKKTACETLKLPLTILVQHELTQKSKLQDAKDNKAKEVKYYDELRQHYLTIWNKYQEEYKKLPYSIHFHKQKEEMEAKKQRHDELAMEVEESQGGTLQSRLQTLNELVVGTVQTQENTLEFEALAAAKQQSSLHVLENESEILKLQKHHVSSGAVIRDRVDSTDSQTDTDVRHGGPVSLCLPRAQNRDDLQHRERGQFPQVALSPNQVEVVMQIPAEKAQPSLSAKEFAWNVRPPKINTKSSQPPRMPELQIHLQTDKTCGQGNTGDAAADGSRIALASKAAEGSRKNIFKVVQLPASLQDRMRLQREDVPKEKDKALQDKDEETDIKQMEYESRSCSQRSLTQESIGYAELSTVFEEDETPSQTSPSTLAGQGDAIVPASNASSLKAPHSTEANESGETSMENFFDMFLPKSPGFIFTCRPMFNTRNSAQNQFGGASEETSHEMFKAASTEATGNGSELPQGFTLFNAPNSERNEGSSFPLDCWGSNSSSTGLNDLNMPEILGGRTGFNLF
ncbi:uncharacterized protein LOC133341464 isoform X2 [Lethenteron reissneri]|uniref:uncharacterized protein LOC133341464 isoform X2 n=1 Tax=Lethenteron reissneri TaxID=7753 RepID=UPI002AB6023C|nr:uncharacterized protein LOC133341464 isoform X2 [Lethenteron reissneri]